MQCGGGIGPSPCTVRILPLGSPTGPLKRSYVHVPVVCWPWHVPGLVLAWLRAGLGWVRVYRVGGGVLPSHGVLVLPGPNHWYCQAHRVPAGTPRPAWPLRTPAAPAPVHTRLRTNKGEISLIIY